MRAVIPCLGYADFLAATLPGWLTILPPNTLRVVTSPNDANTRALCARHGVDCLATDAWTANGAKLNKAAALDAAFAGVTPGTVCLSLDADCYPFGTLPAEATIQPDTLYGCERRA